MWRESEKAAPVHRHPDPVQHLCRFLRTARPHLNKQGILWIFSKTTAFENGQIGLPWDIQKTAHDLGLMYCSEFIVENNVAGYRSANSFIAVKHLPIHAFVPASFDLSPVRFSPSVAGPYTSPNHISQLTVGQDRHPYEKCVELFEDLFSMGTPNGLVFDGFAGSGTAGVAAIRGGFPYLGAELVPHYVRAANRALALALAERRDAAKSA